MSASRYDAVVIGAGFSGLAAAIRLAQFERRVILLERHSLWGGLNSFFKRDGRRVDTGLHALTNYAPRESKGTPLAKILRQLRLDRDELRLGEQTWSEIVFPGARLTFGNGFTRIADDVAREFPSERDRFAELVRRVRDPEGIGPFDADAPRRSARAELATILAEPLLADMLLCAVCYYGSAREDDVDWNDFVILFRSIFLEGFARPSGGIKTVLDVLVKRYRSLGGELRTNAGVARVLRARDGSAEGVVLDDGEELLAERVFSSAGLAETLELAGERVEVEREAALPRLSFLETTWITREPHRALGHDATITFFCTEERFRYGRPKALVDLRSGVVSCTDNYAGAETPNEGLMRVTVAANPERWLALDDDEYAIAKELCADAIADVGARYAPDPRGRSVWTDAFTPRTIRRYTGHVAGSVYGSPEKRRDGRTGIENLFVIGTDQGLVGVVGALLSGITMANRHALQAERA